MTHPRRRPRETAAPTELIGALIGRQMAMAERAAEKINRLLADHLPAGALARATIARVDLATARLRNIPEAARAKPPRLSAADVVVLHELIAAALEELVVPAAMRALAATPPEPSESPAVVERPQTLAAARAQSARLQTRLMDLKRRIVRGVVEDPT
jgi:hypothetical protein